MYGSSIIPASIPYPFQWTLDTGAVDAGVTTESARGYLRQVLDDQDSIIESMCVAATSQIEEEFGLVAIRRTLTYTSNDWPWRQQPGAWPQLQLPRAPFVDGCEIESIKYYDSNGTQQTIDPDDYTAAKTGTHGAAAIWPVGTYQWPQINRNNNGRPNAFEAIYTIGYEDTDAVPDLLRLAILNLVSEMFRRDPRQVNADVARQIRQQTHGFIGSLYMTSNAFLRTI